MTRKIRRSPAYELTLEIRREDFLAPPRPAQRNWLLNRAVNELAADLECLDELTRRFVAGGEAVSVAERGSTALSDDEIMEDWQFPLMRAMAEEAASAHGDVLEIGFGRGIASGYLQELGVRSHTIVECNPSVIERFHAWRAQYPEREIDLIAGKWQEVTGQFGQYDGIFFHTFPLDEEEYLEQAVNSVTFAAHFFAVAAAHLRPGGVLAYMTNEIDSLSRPHQRLLLEHFRSFSVRLCKDLPLPEDTRDTWWIDQMVVVGAQK